jgi:hypothetical protein
VSTQSTEQRLGHQAKQRPFQEKVKQRVAEQAGGQTKPEKAAQTVTLVVGNVKRQEVLQIGRQTADHKRGHHAVSAKATAQWDCSRRVSKCEGHPKSSVLAGAFGLKSRSCLRQPSHHLTVPYESGLLMDHFAIPDHYEIRDTHDVKPPRQLRRSFRVDLEDDCPPRHFGCSALNFRRGHAARPAPRGPEINQDRNGGGGHDFIEDVGVHIEGFGDRRQRRFACAASSLIREMCRGNPVLLSTGTALSNHASLLLKK